MSEICNECGESVSRYSDKFSNRVADLNTVSSRAEMGKPFSEGDFICADCMDAIDEAIRQFLQNKNVRANIVDSTKNDSQK